MGQLRESISFWEVGFVVSEGLVDDLLIFGKPSSHITQVDRDERTDDGKLPHLLLLLLDGNP